jgi:hypothetical protein
MEEITSGVSWLAVIVGAVASFLLGWLWYSPMAFGTKWAEGMGVKMGDASSMPMGAMGAQALGLFLMSWFVGVTAASNALLTVILATLAFAMLAFSGNLFGQVSRYAALTNAGYWIAALVVMVVAQAIF